MNKNIKGKAEIWTFEKRVVGEKRGAGPDRVDKECWRQEGAGLARGRRHDGFRIAVAGSNNGRRFSTQEDSRPRLF